MVRDRRIAFVRLYIVAAEFRGRGFGRQLWDEAREISMVSRWASTRSPEQEATYASDGFASAYGNAGFSAASRASRSGTGSRHHAFLLGSL